MPEYVTIASMANGCDSIEAKMQATNAAAAALRGGD
jgi:hypothetical protein